MKILYKPVKIVDGEYFYACVQCCKVKKASDYYFRSKLYVTTGLPQRQTHCKECTKKRRKLRTLNYKEHDKNQQRILKYGIGTDDYNKMYIKQKKVCKMCKKMRPQVRSGVVMDLHIDHNHITGRVRGLLCTYCNNSLGLLNDSIVLFLRGVFYILVDRIINLLKLK